MAPKYIVLPKEHLYLHEVPAEPRRLVGRSGVSVARTAGAAPGGPRLGVIEAPTRVELLAEDVERVPCLGGRVLIAVVGLPSPSNMRRGSVRVPLQAPDENARVDLQDLLHRVHDAAGHEHFIHAGTPNPPFAPEDDAWARGFVPVPEWARERARGSAWPSTARASENEGSRPRAQAGNGFDDSIRGEKASARKDVQGYERKNSSASDSARSFS